MATHVLTSVVTMVTHMLTSAVTMVSFSVTLFEACLICLLYVPWAWTFSWFLYPNLISDQCWQFSPALPSILSSILNQSRYPLPYRISGHHSLPHPPLSSSSPNLSLPHSPSQMVASRRRSYRTSTIRPGTGYSGISAVPSPAPSTSTSAWWTTLPTVVSEPIPDGVDWESCNYGNWVPVRGHYTISEFQMFDITANFVTIVKQ